MARPYCVLYLKVASLKSGLTDNNMGNLAATLHIVDAARFPMPLSISQDCQTAHKGALAVLRHVTLRHAGLQLVYVKTTQVSGLTSLRTLRPLIWLRSSDRVSSSIVSSS